jgi:ureidoacrylate peracid hydrolase
MGTVRLPKGIVDRVMARRGRLHVFEALDPARTALLAIDLQNAYVAPRGPGFVASAARIVPVVNRLAAAVRTAGATVVWVRNTLGRDALDTWPVYGNFRSKAACQRMLAALEKGAEGHRIWPGADVAAADLVVDKCRYSAFIAGSSDLEARLRERGIDTIVIAGLLANVCCESTARDAMMLGFKVVMVADAVAGHSASEVRSTLANILFVFGDVMTADEVSMRLCSQPS